MSACVIVSSVQQSTTRKENEMNLKFWQRKAPPAGCPACNTITEPGKYYGLPTWVLYLDSQACDQVFHNGGGSLYRAYKINADDTRQHPDLKRVFAAVLLESGVMEDLYLWTFTNAYELGVFINERALVAREETEVEDY